MKKNEFGQIKGLDLKELKVKAKTLREEMTDLVLDKNMKELKDLKMVSKKKKELAQVLTVIGQKELLSQLESRIKNQESSDEKTKPLQIIKSEKIVKQIKKPKLKPEKVKKGKA